MLLMLCRGKLKLRCKSWVIQKSYILIIVPSKGTFNTIWRGESGFMWRDLFIHFIFLALEGWCHHYEWNTHELVSNHVQWRLVLLRIGIVMALWFTVDENWNKVVCFKISFNFQLNWEQKATTPKYGRVHVPISKHARKRGVVGVDHQNDKNGCWTKNKLEKMVVCIAVEGGWDGTKE